MRKAIVVTAISVLIAGCADSEPATTEPQVKVAIREVSDATLLEATQTVGSAAVWIPVLTGLEEVPPNATRALGSSLLVALSGENSLVFVLSVARIDNVVQAHIHVGPKGTNGPVVAFLYGPVSPGGGRMNGLLSNGTLTSANLIGPLAGQTISDLLDEIRAGNAYVNVHTDDGVAPPNTGPGDLPGGEVRGQVVHNH